MYKELNSYSFKKQLDLPENYEVTALLSFGHYNTERSVKILKDTLSNLGINYESKMLAGFMSNILEIRINTKIYWFVVAYGGSAFSEYVHLACVFGSQKNIHIGSCGGLNETISSASLIIPTYSYGDESTTRMYERNIIDNKHYPDGKLSTSLKQKINKSFSLYEGPIITIQAMLAETQEDVQKWSKDGYYGIEMETAILFAISNHFKVPSSALLWVSDNLIKGQVVGDAQHINERELRDKNKNEAFRVAASELLEE